MKLRVALATIASLTVFAAIPVCANGLSGSWSNSPQSVQSNGVAAATTKTPAEWEMYCRAIKNRPRRQACFGEHQVPRRI
jgi:hypothetical protein